MTQQSKLLQQELDLAVSTKQYTRAAELQSEIEALASAQGEAARLEEEIKQAVMQKDYMRAAALQAQLDALESDDQGAAEAAAARAAALQKQLDALTGDGQAAASHAQVDAPKGDENTPRARLSGRRRAQHGIGLRWAARRGHPREPQRRVPEREVRERRE